ncbi:MAG: PilZ domain-containing protein, partial [Myxococcota bacterium]
AGSPPIPCRVAPSRPSRQGDPTLLLELLEPASDAARSVAEILAGERLGTQVTRLREGALPEAAPEAEAEAAPEPEAEAAPEPEAPEGLSERRRNPRSEYETEVQALTPASTGVILGHDLSIEGMRVGPRDDLALGTRLTLALHRGERREPLVVDAEVAREDGDRGLWLRFADLDAAQAQELEVLVCELPPILLRTEVVAERDPVVVSRQVERLGRGTG